VKAGLMLNALNNNHEEEDDKMLMPNAIYNVSIKSQ
jgi:hypothetical protein